MTPSAFSHRLTGLAVAAATGACLVWLPMPGILASQQDGTEGFRFRSSVDMVNVTVTVSDRSGRFVRGLGHQDFELFEDGERQTVTHFDNERVPVSLGIAVDTSGSMAGEKMASARRALERLLFDLLDARDEVFLYRFSDRPALVETWTTDRRVLRRAIGSLSARGGTALYDAVGEAVPLAQSGRHPKKAVLIISDGNDTNSETSVRAIKQAVRDSEVLVYAIGIDGKAFPTFRGGGRPPGGPGGRTPFPVPFPIPGRRQPPIWPGAPPAQPGGGWSGGTYGQGERLDLDALRELSDDSGGRTEVVRDSSDIEPATASIADELSRQYYLGYTSTRPHDGKWHAIDVRVSDRDYRVRARRGYTATP